MMQLTPLFRPASIALVGASPNGTPAEVLANIERIGLRAEIVPVNPNRDQIAGRRCYPSLASAGIVVDVAAIMVRAARVPDAIADCASAGARSAIVFSDGFSEADPDGPALQARIGSIAREAGLPLLGPNCMGYVAPAYGSALYIDRISRMPRVGSIGLITQSGSVGVAGLNHTGTFALSSMISVGNEEGVSIADAIRWLINDGVTRAIAVFAEGFRDGPAFLQAADDAIAAGVPIVVCKTGRSTAAAAAARSHSGSLGSDQRVVAAVLGAHGIVLVNDLDELFAAAELLATGREFTRRLAAVTLSGGHVGLLHDVAAEAGVDFPAPAIASAQSITAALGVARAVTNPLDCWVNDDVVGSVSRGLAALAGADIADGFLVAMDTPANPPTSFVSMGREIAEVAGDLARRDARPVAVVTTAVADGDAAVTERLRDAGVPRLCGLQSTLAAWSAIARTRRRASPARRVAAETTALAPMSEPDGYRLLATIGIATPRYEVCHAAADSVAAAERIGYPVVMKAVSPTFVHKTELGAVRLGVRTGQEAEHAAAELLALDNAEGVIVAETVASGLEAFVGGKIDQTFGPVIVFGAGGTLAELIDDVVVLPAPAGVDEIREALEGLRLARLMDGHRGQPSAARQPLLDAIAAVSRLIGGSDDAAISIDVNPLRILADRVVALDVKIVREAS